MEPVLNLKEGVKADCSLLSFFNKVRVRACIGSTSFCQGKSQDCGSGSAFLFPSGSGSRKENLKKKKTHICKEIGNNYYFLKFPWFFTYEPFFLFFLLHQALQYVIFFQSY